MTDAYRWQPFESAPEKTFTFRNPGRAVVPVVTAACPGYLTMMPDAHERATSITTLPRVHVRTRRPIVTTAGPRTAAIHAAKRASSRRAVAIGDVRHAPATLISVAGPNAAGISSAYGKRATMGRALALRLE